MSRIILNEKGIPIGAVRSYPEEDIYKVRDDFEDSMAMKLTIRVEYEGKTPKEDLGVSQKFSLEQVRDAKTDIVCEAIYRMVDMINKARQESRKHSALTGSSDEVIEIDEDGHAVNNR